MVNQVKNILLVAQKLVGKKPQKKTKPQLHIHATPPILSIIMRLTVSFCLTKVNRLLMLLQLGVYSGRGYK